jgi:hypothetical protein
MNPMEVIGALIIVGHVVGLTLVLLWIGLGMPVTVADFRIRFRQLFFGHHPKSGKMS